MNNVIYCGEYAKISSYSKPNSPAGLVILQKNDCGKQHMFRIDNYEEFMAQPEYQRLLDIAAAIRVATKIDLQTNVHYLMNYIPGI